MKTISKLLVLKYSSKQVAYETSTGKYAIDHTNIASHGRQALQFLDSNIDWGLVVVTSAACKLLKYDAWSDIASSWGTHFKDGHTARLITDADMDTNGLRCIFNDVRSGRVAIVNGNDRAVGVRHHNNDFVAADIAALARVDKFHRVEVGIFTNTAGLRVDMTDDDSAIRVVENIDNVRGLVCDSENSETTGGMTSKLDAIGDALDKGVYRVWLADGRAEDALVKARAGLIGTTFVQNLVESGVTL